MRAWMLVGLALGGCAGQVAASCPSDAGGGGGSTGGSTGGGTSGGTGSSGAITGGATPIALADSWVAGFYASPNQATNVYSNIDTAGYPNGYYTVWPGDPGVSAFGNVSDCSSFSDTLLTRAYGWRPATTHPRPLAEDYYWAIRNGAGFTQITDVNDIEVGDVIALLYPPGGPDTGHVAWIDAAPQPFTGPPAEAGLSAFIVTVIDSDDGFHDGPTVPTPADDDRFLGMLPDGGECQDDLECINEYGPNAQCNSWTLDANFAVCASSGVGRGHMRLFADPSGTLQGFTWSPNYASVFFPHPSPLPSSGATFTGEDIVVGRYQPQ